MNSLVVKEEDREGEGGWRRMTFAAEMSAVAWPESKMHRLLRGPRDLL